MTKEMTVPRKYQLDLVEYALQKNAIIYLPTGSGKTFIAILVIKRLSGSLKKSISEGGKRTIFMCNTVELARQQYVELKKNLNLNIGFYVGDRDLDNWAKPQWQKEIDEKQVLVGTAQIFYDIVRQNYLKVKDINLAILDECHNAIGRHPMLEFLKMLQMDAHPSTPRLIGLTGVLLKGNRQNAVMQDIKNLEIAFGGSVVTVQNIDDYENVLLFSSKPKELLVTYMPTQTNFELMETIKAKVRFLIDNIMKWDIGKILPRLSKGLISLRDPNKKTFIKNLLEDFIFQMEDYGLYAASVAIMSPIIEFEIKKRQSETMALRNLYRYTITFCEKIRHCLVNKMAEFEEVDDVAVDTLETIENYSTEKMRTFLKLISKEFEDKKKEDISCLVFVERRYTAKCLYFVLKRYVEQQEKLQNILVPQFMVGRNTVNSEIESMLDKKWNSSAVEQFRTKQCNLVICSSVLEEGIDVQACNYVIALDRIKTFSSYVQTKGRARRSDSTYAIFSPKHEELKTTTQIKAYRYMQEAITQFLSTRIIDQDEPDDLQNQDYLIEEITPFITKAGAMLTSSSAMQLLAQYCQSLPTDSFGYVSPKFVLNSKDKRGHVVSLHLPLQSPLRNTFLSYPMKNTKMAKISASFKACLALYLNDELNDNLKPVSRKECVAKVAKKLFPLWEKYDDNVSDRNKSNKKNYKIFDRKYPEELSNAMPIPGRKCYLYRFKFNVLFEKTQYTKVFYDLLNKAETVGILTSKKLPKLAEMPLFMNQGRVNVKIEETPIEIQSLTSKQIHKLRQHHFVIMRNILDSWNSFYVYDCENKENSFIVAPANENGIDWDTVNDFQTLEPLRTYSVAERANMTYKPEDFLGKVITKWYDNKPNSYIVTKIRTDLKPTSQFEYDKMNYIDYMEQKYGQLIDKVVHHDQFLIEVKELTRRRVFFNNAIGKSTEISRRLNVITLVPELCHNYKYPGVFWLKSFFIPSVLHRLQTMLHAESLRRRINHFLGLDEMPQNSIDYTPKPIEIDMSLSRAVDLDGNTIETPHKKILEGLPTKNRTVFGETDFKDYDPWKDFLRPFDLNRTCQELYAVDIEYYYKFIMGVAFENMNLLEAEERFLEESQLDIPSSSLKMLKENCKMPNTILLLERDLTDNFSPIEQSELVAALTTANANDVFDMERFELLGDSFLKFSSSIYLVNRFPKWHEGYLTEVKSKLVSNRNLLYCMLSTDIPGQIQSIQLSKLKYEWIPPLASLPMNINEHLKDDETMFERISSKAFYNLELTEDEVNSGICSNEKLRMFLSHCVTDEFQMGLPDDYDDVKLANEKFIFLKKVALANKTVADTLEALLGVVVKNYGIQYGFKILEFFGVLQSDEENPPSNFLDLQFSSRLLRSDFSARDIDGFLINYRNLEKNLGYTFKDRCYLLQALTHPSYPTNRLTGCYQELEFIGDAILDFFVSAYIFENFQRMSPGMLTDLRSALVNNTTLACICVRHRFHLFLLAENALLNESIQKFVEFQQTQDYKVTNQVRILMEEALPEGFRSQLNKKKPFNLAMNVEVPKTLSDIVEALIAAVYLDSRDMKVTWNVVFNLLKNEIKEFSENVPIDPVRQLHEYKFARPQFSSPMVEDDVVMVKCTFTCLDTTVEVNGFGMNTKNAKKAAAKHALQILNRKSC